MVTQERVEKEHLNIYPVLANLCSDLINVFNLFCLSGNGEKDGEDGENFHSIFCLLASRSRSDGGLSLALLPSKNMTDLFFTRG